MKQLIFAFVFLFIWSHVYAGAVSEVDPGEGGDIVEDDALADEGIVDTELDLCIKEVVSRYLGDEAAVLEDKAPDENQARSNEIVQAIIDTCPCEGEEAFIAPDNISAEIQDMPEDQAEETIIAFDEVASDEIIAAVEGHCACDANTVLTMIEFGIAFDLAFNSVAEICELEGAELGELARSLAPGTAGVSSGGGPGVAVSP